MIFRIHFQTGFGLLFCKHKGQVRGTFLKKFILLSMPVKHLSSLVAVCGTRGGTLWALSTKFLLQSAKKCILCGALPDKGECGWCCGGNPWAKNGSSFVFVSELWG